MLWWRLNNDTMDSSEFRCVLCFRTRIVKCFNKERIWLFWASLDCWEEIELKNLLCPAMLPRPRTPSPSACCGNGCTPCVMDLHQQVAMKSGMCAETWQWLNILPILSWTGSGNVGKGKFGKRGEMFNFRKTSTLGLHGVWGGHKYHTNNWMTSR